jgi:hypothetical protein
MKVTTHMPRIALAALAAGAVAAPAAHAGPIHDPGTGCVMMARSCLTMEQVRQIDMHASTVQAPKGNNVVADVRTEAAKPKEAPPIVKGVPVFPTDTTPIAAPEPKPVASGGDGDSFDWPLAGLIAAAVAAMGGAAFVAGRQVRAHAAH